MNFLLAQFLMQNLNETWYFELIENSVSPKIDPFIILQRFSFAPWNSSRLFATWHYSILLLCLILVYFYLQFFCYFSPFNVTNFKLPVARFLMRITRFEWNTIFRINRRFGITEDPSKLKTILGSRLNSRWRPRNLLKQGSRPDGPSQRSNYGMHIAAGCKLLGLALRYIFHQFLCKRKDT